MKLRANQAPKKGREEHTEREREGRQLTSIDIFNREAENIACVETCSLVHGTIEERVGVGILNVEDLSCCCHMTGYPLICWNV